MKQYLELLDHVLKNGTDKADRTGTGTRSVFGYQMRFDLSKGFPLLTTKKLHTRSIIYELLWFLRGETNIKYLKENKVRIWDEWADENGELGPVYGKQWRSWTNMVLEQPEIKGIGENGKIEVSGGWTNKSIDQITSLINMIKTNPDSRRLIVSAWNPAEIEMMKLPPCHCLFQFYVNDGKLSCQLYQRSCDTFLGVPFNIASYALFTMMVAQVTGYEKGEFIWTGGDVHLYKNHIEQAKLQLTREPKELPYMWINPDIKDIFGFKYEDFELRGYEPHPHIEAKVSV